MSYQPGVVSQVWLAPSDNLADKTPFVVEDISYARSEASMGRSIRLGDPIDLGPNGAWTQKAWYGGEDQQQWRDELMYDKGSVDATDRKGAVKLWPGWGSVASHAIPPSGGVPHVILPAPRGYGDNTELLIGFGVTPGGSSAGSSAIWRVTASGSTSYAGSVASPVVAMCRFDNDTDTNVAQLAAILCHDGRFYVYDAAAATLTEKSWGERGGPGALRGMVTFNDSIYMGMGQRFIRRMATQGSSPKWSLVKRLNHVERIIGMEVWNNRIWFGARVSGGEARVFASDGVTVVEAFRLPSELVLQGMCEHYGSLYLFGNKYISGGGQDTVGQVWRYNGASVTLVAEQGEGEWEKGNHGGIHDMCSWGRFLVWSRDGLSSDGSNPGVMLYDAEEDAILEGPSFARNPSCPSVSVRALTVWGDTLAASFRDDHVHTAGSFENMFTVAAMRRDGRFRNSLAGPMNYANSFKSQYVLSSKFDADLPGENKVWLRSVMRARIPQHCQVAVYAQFDEGTETLIHTETYNGDGGWRQVEFPFSSAGGFHRSLTVRYKLVLSNTNITTAEYSTPEVESMTVMFQPSPRKRMRWNVRFTCTDGQELSDGSAHPLATREAQVAKLLELWENGEPVAFWEMSPDTATPSNGDARYVMLTDFLEQPMRLTSDSDEIVSNVNLLLTEVA